MTRWYAWPCMIHEGIDPLDACPVCDAQLADIRAQPHASTLNLRGRAARKGWQTVRDRKINQTWIGESRASVASHRARKRRRRAA